MHELFAGGPNTAPLDDSARVLIADGVAQAVVFVVRDSERDDCMVKQGLQRYPGRFVPFLVPRLVSVAEIDRVRVAVEDPTTAYRGVGEVAMYLPEWSGFSLMSGPAAASFDALFRSLEQRGMVFYVHLRDDQDADFAAMLRAHPKLKVAIHGHPSPDLTTLASWLRTYPNLYFSIDVMNLLQGGPLLTSSRTAFLGSYDLQRLAALDRAWATWRDIIVGFPDRVFWGTDTNGWMYDSEVHRRFIEFSRAFVARLPADLQRGYSYANAARVMGMPLR